MDDWAALREVAEMLGLAGISAEADGSGQMTTLQ
jgi:hypothetical protein|eukprot:COSAG01_NODE_3344_length_6226_cov_2.175261_7_plen_34_part_00